MPVLTKVQTLLLEQIGEFSGKMLTHDYLADSILRCRNTVQGNLKILEALGLIRIIRVAGNAPCKYEISDKGRQIVDDLS